MSTNSHVGRAPSSAGQVDEDDGLARRPNPWARATLFLMPVLAGLGPFVSPSPGSSGMAYAYRILLAAAILPAFLAALDSGRRGNKGVPLLVATSLAFAGWGAVSLQWAPDVSLGRRQLIGVVLALMGTWIAVGLTSRDDRRIATLRGGFVLAAFVMCLIGLWQYATGQNLWTLVGQTFRFEGNPLIGSFVNPNNFAVFLLGCLGPILTWTIMSHSFKRVIGIALLATTSFVILGTTSRAGVIGFALVGAAVLVVTMMVRPKTQVPIIFALSSGAVIAWILAGGAIRSGFTTAFGGESTESDALRVELTQTAFRQAWESGGIGLGPAGFQVTLGSDVGNTITAAHNTFLQIAAEYGLPVFLPFVLLMIYLLNAMFRRGRDKRDLRAAELLAGLIAVGTGALTASSLIADPSWWLLIGYLIVLARPAREPEPVPA